MKTRYYQGSDRMDQKYISNETVDQTNYKIFLMRANKLLLVIASAAVLHTGCKKWDDHNAITDPAVTKNLFEQVSQQTDLSKFAELLTKSGYDKVIASSKTFTVFAPSNAALATLDASIVNDSAKLRLFVGNHIANQSYYSSSSNVRIAMLNGKYNNLLSNKIEDANITAADKLSKNGVLQVIDKMLPALSNSWETLEKNATIPAKQKSYLLAQFRKIFDATNAVQIGVNPTTGDPIYQAGTDSITTNLFWRVVHDLRTESKQYTFFILDNTAWDAEVVKLNPYFATGSVDSTYTFAAWELVKDLAVEGLYTAANMPDTIVSKFGIKMPIEKASITQSIKTSNGIIHIMSKLDVQPKNKLRQFVIQAENYRTTSHNKRGNTYFRDRYNPLTGTDFKDVLVYNHGTSLFNINYRLSGVYSTKYKAYWVAVNDFQAATFQQKLGLGIATSTTLPYVNVTANNYNEILLGEFTLSSFQVTYDIFLTAANSGTAAVSPLVCDYIRLEPVF